MPHFVDRFLPVVAEPVVHVHGQIDRLFPPAHASLNQTTQS
jgi:hypothetical protein